jgi:hypothetical protein
MFGIFHGAAGMSEAFAYVINGAARFRGACTA